MKGDTSSNNPQGQGSQSLILPIKERRRSHGPKSAAELALQHYSMILLRRKWLILAVFLFVSAGTAVVSYLLPNVYTSETLILVDPQQVPDKFVQPTVTGDIRNRLSTLSQQILSATRLQKIIDTFNLYPKERKTMAREEVITLMRGDITVEVVEEPAQKERKPPSSNKEQDLTAFRIAYSGKDPKMVAQVTNELASLFIGENLRAREQMATGTANFMDKELQGTKKQLEEQEAKVKEFKLRHPGEMPEQQQANISILSQLQVRLQAVTDAINRAQQQKIYAESLLANQPADQNQEPSEAKTEGAPAADAPTPSETKLIELLARYGESHPDIKRTRKLAEVERAEKAKAGQAPAAPSPAANLAAEKTALLATQNRITGAQSVASLKAQIASADAEIAEGVKMQEKLIKSILDYQQKLEAVPVREQEIAEVVRDYAESKEHYKQLLEKKLAAEMATQLEIRQQGEKFTILDPARVPEKPSSPNRLVINIVGCLAGLVLGFAGALAREFSEMSITSPLQIGAEVGVFALGTVPMISTPYDIRRRKRLTWAGAASTLAVVFSVGGYLLYYYRDYIF